ncbi:unnamed protein product [Owenia fusiformis]|uniref:Uncharacterized protein n=1 Tax=Owenia fusiformis TaxID=6347 RepID=A0A8J1T4P3_OWEFU|nr:unnamed protein product [Owenia fusiformis]
MDTKVIPIVPQAKRLNGFSIESLMSKPETSPTKSMSPALSSPGSRDTTPSPHGFHPVGPRREIHDITTQLPSLHQPHPLMLHENRLALEHLKHLQSVHPATLPGSLAHLGGHPGLTVPHLGVHNPLHSMLLGAQKEHLPFYPWLTRHPFLHNRFAGPDGLLLPPFRKPKRIRTAFSPTQLLRLEHAFEKNHYVVGQERKELASNLGLTETQVKVWFQNRRTKYKRVKSEEGCDIEGADSETEDDDRAAANSKTAHHLSRWRTETNQIHAALMELEDPE